MAKLFFLPFFLFSVFSSLIVAGKNQDDLSFFSLGSKTTEIFTTVNKKVEISLKFNKKEFHPLYNHFELKCTDLKTKRFQRMNLFYVEFPTAVSFEKGHFVMKAGKKGKSYILNIDSCSLERAYFDD